MVVLSITCLVTVILPRIDQSGVTECTVRRFCLNVARQEWARLVQQALVYDLKWLTENL